MQGALRLPGLPRGFAPDVQIMAFNPYSRPSISFHTSVLTTYPLSVGALSIHKPDSASWIRQVLSSAFPLCATDQALASCEGLDRHRAITSPTADLQPQLGLFPGSESHDGFFQPADVHLISLPPKPSCSDRIQNSRLSLDPLYPSKKSVFAQDLSNFATKLSFPGLSHRFPSQN